MAQVLESLCSPKAYVESKNNEGNFKYPFARAFAFLRGAMSAYQKKYIEHISTPNMEDLELAKSNIQNMLSILAKEGHDWELDKIISEIENHVLFTNQEVAFKLLKEKCDDLIVEFLKVSVEKTANPLTALYDSTLQRSTREQAVSMFSALLVDAENVSDLYSFLKSLNDINTDNVVLGHSATLSALLNGDNGLLVHARALCAEFNLLDRIDFPMQKRAV